MQGPTPSLAAAEGPVGSTTGSSAQLNAAITSPGTTAISNSRTIPPLGAIGILLLVAAAEILPLQFCFASSDRAADNVDSR
jgi:hypothetical protein